MDGKLATRGKRRSTRKSIPPRGELVLGQSSRNKIAKYFDSNVAFIGALAHAHIWDYVKSGREIRELFDDCTYRYCGNAVEWVDFRSGTRGPMRIRWPSNIKGVLMQIE